jgi:hypothetical protein
MPPPAVRAHLWVAASLASIVGSVGAGLAGLLALIDVTTLMHFGMPTASASGVPLRGFDYFWARYGFWLFEAAVVIAVVGGVLLTWRCVLRGRPRGAWFSCIAVCALSTIPLLINAARAT